MAGKALVPCFGSQSGFVIGSLAQQDDGYWQATHPDGSVVSIQPDGRVEHRPAGSYGAFERAGAQGDFYVYCPIGLDVFVFRLTDVVPNV